MTDSNGVKASGKTSNLSNGGLCATLDRACEVGSNVELSVTLVFSDDAFSEALNLDARVVWSTAFGDHHQVGVSFLAITDDQRSYLEIFLRYLGSGS